MKPVAADRPWEPVVRANICFSGAAVYFIVQNSNAPAPQPQHAAPQSMRLPPQLFASVLSTLRRPSGLDKSEMRRTTRMPVWARMTIYQLGPESGGEPVKVLARDISMEGIGMLSGIARGKGESFVVELPRDGGETAYLACRSVHCVELGTSLYSIGACFTGEVRPDNFRNARPMPAAAHATAAAAAPPSAASVAELAAK